MPGTAFAIPDDLSHGPLDDGRARADYMRSCALGYGDESLDQADAFRPWRDLIARVDETRPDAIVVWVGDNVSEATFVRMACWWLRDHPVRLLCALVPAVDGPHYVAVHMPAALAALHASARSLSDTERAEFVEDFLRIRDDTGPVRRWEGGRIVGVSPDRYDSLLLASCTTEWTAAARVVGSAMGRCDRRNLMSDLFFSSRLQRLIDTAMIEAAGHRARLRDYAVRLPSRPDSAA